jgi:CheY-like chemotaxis protein
MVVNANPVYLIHWDDDGRNQRAVELRKYGYEVIDSIFSGSKLFNKLEELQPWTILIDLTRLPSQGRDVGVALRRRKGTRHIPIVFVGGEAEKVADIKALLPDAGYCDWDTVETAIVEMSNRSLDDVVIPSSAFAAYAGKPVVEKLGISKGQHILVVDAPENLVEILGELPTGVKISPNTEDFSLAMWFSSSKSDLEENLDRLVAASKQAPLWIAWPKKASGVSSDLSQPVVRELCMQAGMVDYKVCSISPIWTALLFTWRGFEVDGEE